MKTLFLIWILTSIIAVCRVALWMRKLFGEQNHHENGVRDERKRRADLILNRQKARGYRQEWNLMNPVKVSVELLTEYENLWLTEVGAEQLIEMEFPGTTHLESYKEYLQWRSRDTVIKVLKRDD